jgi:hypothetical protein
MKTLIRIVIPSMLFAAGAAMAADPIVIDLPRGAMPPTSMVTRAEVLADLHMWRLAGMQEFTRNELMDRSDRYQMALARYQALRASPQYTELVQKIQERPSAMVMGR